MAAEEDFDGAIGFLQRDRMTLAVVGRVIVLLRDLRLVAAGEHGGEAASRE